jgi:hypothetical protein
MVVTHVRFNLLAYLSEPGLSLIETISGNNNKKKKESFGIMLQLLYMYYYVKLHAF